MALHKNTVHYNSFCNQNKIALNNDENTQVYVFSSIIPNSNNGLKATKNLNLSETVCYYSGYIEYGDYIKNHEINGTYAVNLWSDMVLLGDSSTGDLGIFANTSNTGDPGNINASFDLKNLVIYDRDTGQEKFKGWKQSQTLNAGDRGRFPIVVKFGPIQKDSEIFIKYSTLKKNFNNK